jgi:hypothetical protein
MLMMNLVGSETQELNDKYIKMVEDNPLQDKNADRLLEELQNNSISDIEVPQTLSLKDFSFESFRQDLTDYYAKQQDFYRRMPNGVYSGFKNQLPEFAHIPESLVALVGYPKKPEGKMEHTYTELYLVLQPVDSIPQWCEVNKADVLHFLQQNKTANRYVPNWITDNDIERVTRLSVALKEWMRAKAPQQVMSIVNDVMGGKSLNQFFSTKKSSLVEDKFQIQNFDLIVWEYISAT